MKLLTVIFILTISSCTQGHKTTEETKLDLSDHNLKTIPDSVFGKTSLVYLNLGNGVTYYPPLSALVDSNANRLTEVPEKIGDLVNLKILLLNANKLTTLPNSITKLTKLEVLDLSLNTDLRITQELNKIKKLTNLKVLKIVNVKINSDSIEFITVTLPKTKIIFSVDEYLDSLQ